MSETRRPRILLVTRNLPPLVGGMERLNWHMAEELVKVAEIRVIGPEGSAALAPEGVQIREAPLRPLWKFLWRARMLARRKAKAWRPDMVLAGSGLTAPIARAAARACGAKTAVYVHGLDIAVRNFIYRALWLPAIRDMDRVIANSRATAELCRGIGVDPARIGIVHPGVDLPEDVDPRSGVEPLFPRQRAIGEGPGSEPLSPRERGRSEGTNTRNAEGLIRTPTSSFRTPRSDDPESSSLSSAFRTTHNLGNRTLLLSVGRLSARKGLREFVEQALPRIVATHPDVVLLIVGDAPKDALHARAQTPASIRAVAEQVGVADNIRFLGKIPDDDLLAVYRATDVHVFPVREIPGDPEGFGMVAVEAAAHGLPTVAFATGGVVDAVAEGRSGRLVQPGDYAAMADAVVAMLAERGVLRAPCIEFAHKFAWSEFGIRVARQLDLP